MDGGEFGDSDRRGARLVTAAALAEAARRREMEADAAAALTGLVALRRRLEAAPASLRDADGGLALTLSHIDAALADAVRALHAPSPPTGREGD